MIQKAVNVLLHGGILIYPTDTIYAIGCDIASSRALEKLGKIWGVKPQHASWSFIFSDLSSMSEYIKQLDGPSFKLIKKTLPGPYTYILQGSNKLPREFRKRKTVGVRIPDNEIAQALVRELGRPLVTTSIRDEDELLAYTTDPELIYDKWSELVPMIIDGGYGDNEPSTVIDLTSGIPELIREGKGPIDFLE